MMTAPNTNGVADSGYVNIPQGKQVYVKVSNAYTPYDTQQYGTAATTVKAYQDYCKQSTLITNQNNFNVFIDLHDVSSKRDLELTTQDPISAINSSASTTGSVFTAPGQSLLGAAEFVTDWNIMKTTKLCLAAGESWEHVIIHRPRKVVNGAVFAEMTPTSNFQSLKGLTHYLIAVVYGGPVDLGTATTALTGVTTGGVDSGNVDSTKLNTPHISWITNKVYASRQINDNTQNNSQVNNLTSNVNYATYHVMEKDGDNNIEIDA